MTHSKSLKHLGWMAAILAVGVLSLNAQAGSRGGGHNKQRQGQRQTQKKDHGQKRQRASQSRPSRREAKASRSRQAQRSSNHDNNRRAKQRRGEGSARAQAPAQSRRGANWGTNAQRKQLKERQRTVKRQTQKLEQKTQANRQELRGKKLRLDARAQSQRRETRNRSDRLNTKAHRLNEKSNALRSAGSHSKPPSHTTGRSYYKNRTHYNPGHGYSRSTYGRAGHYGQGVYRKYGGQHNDRNRFGFRIGFGSYGSYGTSQFYYGYGHRRYGCDSGGYYTSRWVEPILETRYDSYGNPYTVVIQEGYYKRVWVSFYCTRGLHHYNRY